MKNFRSIISKWVGKKLNKQIDEIDKICSELDIDPSEWFESYRKSRDFTGLDFFNEMLTSFIFYISNKFDEPIKKFLPIKGYNIWKEPYYGILTEISYGHKKGFYFSNDEKKDLKAILRTLTISQREELMKDKIFSYIILQTKFKLFSKKETRALKLRSLNEYQRITK